MTSSVGSFASKAAASAVPALAEARKMPLSLSKFSPFRRKAFLIVATVPGFPDVPPEAEIAGFWCHTEQFCLLHTASFVET